MTMTPEQYLESQPLPEALVRDLTAGNAVRSAIENPHLTESQIFEIALNAEIAWSARWKGHADQSECRRNARSTLRKARVDRLRKVLQEIADTAESRRSQLLTMPRDISAHVTIIAGVIAAVAKLDYLVDRARVYANELADGRASNVVDKLESALRAALDRLEKIDDLSDMQASEVRSAISAALAWRLVNETPQEA